MTEAFCMVAWSDRYLPLRHRLSFADRRRRQSNDREVYVADPVCDFLTRCAEAVLIDAIEKGQELRDDGTLDRAQINPLVELFSVGFLAKATQRDGVSIYRVTEVARRKYQEWRGRQ